MPFLYGIRLLCVLCCGRKWGAWLVWGIVYLCVSCNLLAFFHLRRCSMDG